MDNIITEDKIVWAINSFLPFKSPGLDKILPAMLQKSSEAIYKIICTLFKASLKLKYIPKCWRGVNVVFIMKQGKTNYSLAENYRPIDFLYVKNTRENS